MKNKTITRDLLSREQEIDVLIRRYFRNLRLYKMRLVTTQLSIFGDLPNSDQLEVFLSSLRRQLVEWQCVSDGRSI